MLTFFVVDQCTQRHNKKSRIRETPKLSTDADRSTNTERNIQGHGAVQCSAVHCTALHCTTLHSTSLHCPALHCTVALYASFCIGASISIGREIRCLPYAGFLFHTSLKKSFYFSDFFEAKNLPFD